MSASTESSGVDNLVILARAAAEAGDDEEATALWSRVLERDPANSAAWLGKARAVTMTLATMQARYGVAESYAKRGIDNASDKAAAKREACDLLTVHVRSMYTAAQSHFDEFATVDGAGEEFVTTVDVLLGACGRIAELTGETSPHALAVEICDALLDHPIVGQVGGLVTELKKLRTQHAGPAGIAAPAEREKSETRRAPYVPKAFRDDDEEDADAAPVGDDDEEDRAGRVRVGILGGCALVLVILGGVGFPRWGTETTPSTAPTAQATALPPSPSPVASIAPAASGSPPKPSSAPSASASASSTYAKVTQSAAPARPKPACDPGCFYNARCQLLRSGDGAGECCHPIPNEENCK